MQPSNHTLKIQGYLHRGIMPSQYQSEYLGRMNLCPFSICGSMFMNHYVVQGIGITPISCDDEYIVLITLKEEMSAAYKHIRFKKMFDCIDAVRIVSMEHSATNE
jgi:hypothetical protein